MKLSVRKLLLEFRNIRKIVECYLQVKHAFCALVLYLINSDLTCSSRLTEAWEKHIIHWKCFQREKAPDSAYTSSQERDESGKMHWQLIKNALPSEKMQRSAEPQPEDSSSSCSSQVLTTIYASHTRLHSCSNGKCSKISIIFWGEQVFHSKRYLFGKDFIQHLQFPGLHERIWFNLTSG